MTIDYLINLSSQCKVRKVNYKLNYKMEILWWKFPILRQVKFSLWTKLGQYNRIKFNQWRTFKSIFLKCANC